MLKKIIYIVLIILMPFFTSNVLGNYEKLVYEFTFNDLDGSQLNLSNFKNKVIVIINVASKCGFTKQY